MLMAIKMGFILEITTLTYRTSRCYKGGGGGNLILK